jgi:CHAD domain-containing protein/uncharacterized protein YjbK
MEIEAKFSIPNEETYQRLQAAEQLAGFFLSTPKIQEVHDRYLDTVGFAIKKAGYYCRIREFKGSRIVTIKELAGAEGAVHKREELEVSLAGDVPPTQWPKSPAQDFILQCVGHEPLVELFELRQIRVIRFMKSPKERTVAELCLDQVRLLGHENGNAYFELEVELLPEGTEHDLALIQNVLVNEWAMAPESRSKFERAWTMMTEQALQQAPLQESGTQPSMTYAGGEAISSANGHCGLPSIAGADGASVPHVVQHKDGVRAAAQPRMRKPPKKPGLKSKDTMAEGARKTLYFHFKKMLVHEPGTRTGQNIEELHDMRVSTRRMRAALGVFEAYLDKPRIKPFAKDLKRVGRTLGAVRDLDVFREKTQIYIDRLPPERQNELEPLMVVLNAEHQKARNRLLELLDSDRYVRFKKSFSIFLKKPGAAEPPMLTSEGAPFPHRIRHVLPIVVYQRLARVRAFEELVNKPDVAVEQLHQLRIAFKGLRYTLEFFREVLGRDADALIKEIKEMQDHLGALQDAVVTCNILRDFLNWGAWGHGGSDKKAAQRKPVIAPGVASYLAARQMELKNLLDQFPGLWIKIANQDFSRCIASLVAPL